MSEISDINNDNKSIITIQKYSFENKTKKKIRSKKKLSLLYLFLILFGLLSNIIKKQKQNLEKLNQKIRNILIIY